jgi:hypothetical protein
MSSYFLALFTFQSHNGVCVSWQCWLIGIWRMSSYAISGREKEWMPMSIPMFSAIWDKRPNVLHPAVSISFWHFVTVRLYQCPSRTEHLLQARHCGLWNHALRCSISCVPSRDALVVWVPGETLHIDGVSTFIQRRRHFCTRWQWPDSDTDNTAGSVRSGFDPEKRLPWDVRIVFQHSYKFIIKVCIGKSTSVLLTLQIPALGCPLSNLCCRCAGIVLQNECQVANWVT